MKKEKTSARLGQLIAALYEEATQLTSNRKLQTYIVCLALLDMQSSTSPDPSCQLL